MEHSELLSYLADALERLNLPYLVTGSTATIAYGEPRFTNDIDVVVDLPLAAIDGLLAAFPAEQFYVSRTAVQSAIAQRRQFNIIQPASGLKIDVIIATESEFDRARMERAERLPIQSGRTVAFASAEDVILKKMQYFQEGGSDKHLRDIAGVFRIRGDRIDRSYLGVWAARLGVAEVWSLVQSRLAIPPRAPE